MSMTTQVKNHEDHNANLAAALEHEASECLVKHMRATGHPEAHRLCTKLNVPAENGALLEVDGVVLADNCAVVVEVKSALSEAAAIQLHLRLKIIR
jgi:hypothetical protein